jgi:hypothetical protein
MPRHDIVSISELGSGIKGTTGLGGVISAVLQLWLSLSKVLPAPCVRKFPNG